MSRPGMQFCDRCGANLYWTGGGDNITHNERNDFDRNVAILFYIIGALAIVAGLVFAFAFLAMGSGFEMMTAWAALILIGALAVGGFFIFLARRIMNSVKE